MKKLLIILICFALLAASAVAEVTPLVGEALPEFTFDTTDGAAVSVSELLTTKDLVVLNIFASWCPPCRAEFPEMERVYQDHGDRMEIVAVSGDPDDTLEMIADYKAELGLSFPMGLGTDIADYVRLEAYPTTLVIDKRGTIAYFQVGSFVSEAQFRGLIDYFLSERYDGTAPGVFNVYVCDKDGEPVPGAVVQFCDAACRLYTSDADGVITFTGKPARYSLHIQSVPEGYGFDPSFEAVSDGSGEWAIIELTKE